MMHRNTTGGVAPRFACTGTLSFGAAQNARLHAFI
jgi:hypothetical protein